MPRRPRIHIPGAFHHISIRGNHRNDIFFNPTDRDLLNSIVAESLERHSARIHAYCWLTTHVHLLIEVGEHPLGRIMQRIASRYARAVQRRLETTGHLFERRYHAKHIDNDSYFLEVVRYIHLNPVRANMVTEPDAYPWSSHHAYCGTRTEPWVTTDLTLQQFHPDRAKAIDAYRRFLTLKPNPAAQAYLCNLERRHDGEGGLVQLLEEACERFQISTDDICSPMRSTHLSHARAWIAHQAATERVATITAVARHLKRTESAIRQLMQRYASSVGAGAEIRRSEPGGLSAPVAPAPAEGGRR